METRARTEGTVRGGHGRRLEVEGGGGGKTMQTALLGQRFLRQHARRAIVPTRPATHSIPIHCDVVGARASEALRLRRLQQNDRTRPGTSPLALSSSGDGVEVVGSAETSVVERGGRDGGRVACVGEMASAGLATDGSLDFPFDEAVDEGVDETLRKGWRDGGKGEGERVWSAARFEGQMGLIRDGGRKEGRETHLGEDEPPRDGGEGSVGLFPHKVVQNPDDRDREEEDVLQTGATRATKERVSIERLDG
jgi:hypothetical protein